MKRLLIFAIVFTSNIVLFAQNAEAVEDPIWSGNTKIYLLILFAALCIWLAIRTFRNKPSA